MTASPAYVAPARADRPEDQLIRDYVDLGVTVGYVGNCDLQRGYDDRCFRVFTSTATTSYASCCDGPKIYITKEAAEAGEWDTPAVRAQLDAIRAKVAEGKLFLVGAKRWLAPAMAAVAAGELPKYWTYV